MAHTVRRKTTGPTLSERALLPLAAALALLGAASPCLGATAECPDPPPSSARDRRVLAKEWFSRAEAAETAGDAVAAVKAYSCSFSMVPHPSTAYNLARAAERAGDLKLAVSAHRDYLTLQPDAPDRAEVEARIISLKGRMAAGSVLPEVPPPPLPPKPAEPSPEPRGPPVSELAARSAPEGSRMGTAEWAIAGVGAAALVAGVVFNVGARSAMSDCRSMARANEIAGARAACDRAQPFAYVSYGLFATAGLAAVTDTVLVWSKPAAESSLALWLTPAGGGLAASGRF